MKRLGAKVYKFALAGLILAASWVFFPGCSSTVTNPAPSLNSISPTSALAGSAGFTLTINGRNFLSGASTVLWNGQFRTTTFLSDTQLQATINPNDITLPGAASVAVFTQGPGGGTSNSATFTINPQPSLVPTISSLSPSSAFASGPGFNLNVNGSNFAFGAVVTWNGGNRSTTFVNGSQLRTSISNTDIATAGPAQVSVLNPPPGGGAANPVTFQINNAQPGISSFSPASVTAGGMDFTLTVNGSGFACATFNGTTCATSATGVNWNGSSRTTTFVNSGQVTALIKAADISAAGTAQITVSNPTPGGGTSLPSPYPIIPAANGAGLPELVDMANNGAQANTGVGAASPQGPAMSGNGRFIAFASDSTNLVSASTNRVVNVFLRDTCLGVTSACTPQTTLISVAADGVSAANGTSSEPSISSDGRFIVFSSTATNLVSPPLAASPAQQVYLRDTCLGATTSCTPKTALITADVSGNPGDAASSQPAISADGRFVVFSSLADNLVTGTPLGAPQQVYLRDTCFSVTSGCTAATILVSTPDGTTLASAASSQPAVASTSSGQFISFSSTATNLVSPSLPMGTPQQIYRRTTCLPISSGCAAATVLVSTPDGTTPGTDTSSQSSLSTDGRFVAFASLATNLISPALPTSTPQQLYRRDTCTGVSGTCNASTTLVSVASDGVSPGNGSSQQPSLSSTGRFVAFSSAASDLVATDTNGFQDVFIHDTCLGVASGCTAKTALASVAADGTTQGNGDSLAPVLSTDGKFVSFLSNATNLVSNDTNAAPDIFLAITTF